jgi:hypothetical protein
LAPIVSWSEIAVRSGDITEAKFWGIAKVSQGELHMAKVYGTHMLRLHSHVKEEDFEKFVTEELYRLPRFEGWDFYLLKGIRGEREGRYLLMFEIESLEALNRYYPPPGHSSEEADEWFDSHPEVAEAWFEKLPTFAAGLSVIRTEYLVVGR